MKPIKPLTKHLKISDDTHNRLMGFKVQGRFKSADEAINKLLEDSEWTP